LGTGVIDPSPRAGPAGPATIDFPMVGGTDCSFAVEAPARSRVLQASMSIEGRAAVPPPELRTYDISDVTGSAAWEGAAEDSNPSGGPGNYQQMKFGSDGLSEVRAQDGNTHGTLCYGMGAPYQLFRFNVTEDSVASISVKWVGIGWDALMDSTSFAIYIYKGAKWESMASHSEDGIGDSLFTVNRTFQSPKGSYIDAAGHVYILASGPWSWIAAMVETDVIQLGVLGAFEQWPTDVALDVGGDGSVEFQQAGALCGTASVNPGLLAVALQGFIDGCDPACGNVTVPFVFSSSTGGILAIGGATFEFDAPPVFSPAPPDACRFDEDTAAQALLDLDRYFRDDRTANLAYEVVVRPDDQRIMGGLDPDGHHMSFWTNSRDWSGTREFGIRAADSSNLTCTGFINVTIDPVNDPPVFMPVADQAAVEDSPFLVAVRAPDADDPPSNVTYSDDCRLFDIEPLSGVISFTPNNSQVGVYQVTVFATDTHGAAGSASFTLAVQNVNDAPVLDCPDELDAIEHEPFTYRMKATDEDAGDRIIYSVDSGIDGLFADESTGEISITFGEQDVGEHQIDLVATDLAGAEDRRTVLLVIRNVNDPPVIEAGCELNLTEGEEFDYTVRASDPDRGDRLTFTLDTDRLEIDPDTGRVRFTPSNADVGKLRFRVVARDIGGLAAEARFMLNIMNVNEPPADPRILSPRAGAVYVEGQDMLFNATATDPDRGAVLSYTWLDGGRLLGRGPAFSARLVAGRHVITLVVSDGELNTSVSSEIQVRGRAAAAGFGLSMAQMAILALVLTAGAVAGAAMARRRRKRPAPGKEAAPPAPQTRNAAGSGGQPAATAAPADARAPATGNNGNAADAPPAGRAGEIAGAVPSTAQPSPAAVPAQPPSVMPWGPPFGPAPPWAGYPSQAPMFPGYPQFAYPPQGHPGAEYPGIQPPAGHAAFNGPGGAQAFMPWQAQPAPPAAARADRADRQPAPAAEAPQNDSPGPAAGPAASGQGLEVPEQDELVTRDAMRTAIADAKRAIEAAKAAGMEPEECERLLSEAMAASYRMDYPRARGLARKAEAVAMALLNRAAGGNGNPKADRPGRD